MFSDTNFLQEREWYGIIDTLFLLAIGKGILLIESQMINSSEF